MLDQHAALAIVEPREHLSHLIALQGVTVEPVDAALVVTVQYTLLDEGSAQVARFTTPGSTP